MATSQSQGDIKFIYDTVGPADISLNGATLLRDPGFETAVLISIFSDRRADVDDPLPTEDGERRGWWGDALATARIGSRLWLLDRSNINPTTIAQGEQYVEESLGWMLADGSAKTIKCTGSRGARADEIIFEVTITGPAGSVFFKFFYNWKYQLYGGAE